MKCLNRFLQEKKINSPKYYEKIQKENIFSTIEFNKQMRKLGYISPQKFIWHY
jgi:hypothetical protein